VSSSEIEMCEKRDEPGDRKTFRDVLTPHRRSRAMVPIYI
jgi:hypothetical protein